MNKRITAVIVVSLLLIGGLVWFRFDKTDRGASGGKLYISATYYPLYDMARNIAGNKAIVTNLTPAGAEPHTYEPSPSTFAKTQAADVFIYNGGAFEPWADSFLESYSHTKVKASERIQLKPGNDPHFWLDPVLAKRIVLTISDGLAAADPVNAAYYQSRAEEYNRKLDKLDAAFRQGLASCRLNTIVSSHDAFSYVADRYGFTVEAIAGISPEEEPSAGRMAEISRMVQDKGVKYIFFESLVSPRLADTIAQESGAKTLVFDPIEGLTDEDQKQGKDYLSVQRENLAALRTALACQ